MGGVRGCRDGLALCADLLGGAEVHRCRGVQVDPAVAVLMIVEAKNSSAKARACWKEPNRAGKSGWYFRVLNCASLYGLSLDVFGREWCV